jgi:adenylate cyclase
MRTRLGNLLHRLANAGALADDTPDVRLQKAVLTLSAAIVSVLSFYWVIMYLALGLRLSASIPFAYQLLSVAGLVHFLRTKDDRFLRWSQLIVMLLLPFFLQWSLGGFVNSSGVMVWALLAPLGALLIRGPERADIWFGAYLGLAIVSGLIDRSLAASAPPIPPWLTVTNFVMNIGAVSGVAYFLLHYFARERQRALDALGLEHQRSENLLLSILPKPIADRLKRDRSTIADLFPETTVLFADIVDFTPASASLTPEGTVAWLNDLFSLIDSLSDRFGLEKIKTVGDAYMAAAGLPTPRADHAEAAADMALEIQRQIATRTTPNGRPLQMRIGIHTGPVVAGVIGTRKFIYDLWGDTVNTASRMESQGLPGAIQVTEAAYHRLRDHYELECRGTIQVKGKGEMLTYVLKGRRGVSWTTTPVSGDTITD